MGTGNTEFESVHVKLAQQIKLGADNRVEIVTEGATIIIRTDDTKITVPLLDVEEDGAVTIAKGDDVRYHRPDGTHVDFSVGHYGFSYALLLALAEAHNVRLLDNEVAIVP